MAFDSRVAAAELEREGTGTVCQFNSGDTDPAALFHKSLPHDELGQVNPPCLSTMNTSFLGIFVVLKGLFKTSDTQMMKSSSEESCIQPFGISFSITSVDFHLGRYRFTGVSFPPTLGGVWMSSGLTHLLKWA